MSWKTMSSTQGLLETDRRDVKPGKDNSSFPSLWLVYPQPWSIPICYLSKKEAFDCYHCSVFFNSLKWKEHWRTWQRVLLLAQPSVVDNDFKASKQIETHLRHENTYRSWDQVILLQVTSKSQDIALKPQVSSQVSIPKLWVSSPKQVAL